jgi:hypothetical protein
MDLQDSRSLFHQCLPNNWNTRSPDQPYDHCRDRIPPIPGFAMGISNSQIRSAFGTRLSQACWLETTSSYVDQRVIPAFERVNLHIMTQFEHLPTTYAGEYTVAFRSNESGIPSVHIPLFDFFVHILAQSYQYSAVEDTGIHLPMVDRLLHECYVYWNYVPKHIG